MKTYILLLLGQKRQTNAVHVLTAENDAQAETEAHAFAQGKAGLTAYEIWHGGRKVAAFTADGAPDTFSG